MSNQYIFSEMYPGKELSDYNCEEAYEMGVDVGIFLTTGQRDSIVRLIDKEKEENDSSKDGSFNPYWDSILDILKGDGSLPTKREEE